MKDILKTIEKYFLIIISIIIIIGAILVKDNIREILAFIIRILKPLIEGAFISYLLYPLVEILQKRIHLKNNNITKTLSIIITYIIASVLFVGFLCLCIPGLIKSISALIEQIPLLYENINIFVKNSSLIQEIDSIIDVDTMISSLVKNIADTLPTILTWTTEIVKSGTNFLVAIVISIYITFDIENICNNLNRMCHAYIGELRTNNIKNTIGVCDRIFHKFISGKAIDSFIIGMLTFVVLIIFRIEYTPLLSIIVGITNMIPYIGPIIGGVIGVLILIIVSPKNAIIFGIIILIIQQLDGHIIGPKILGKKIDIGPLWILLSVIIGGFISGIIGMFMGPPIVAIIAHLLNDSIEKRISNHKEPEE